MKKHSVLVVDENPKRWEELRTSLPKALPHCSFVFETSMRDASDSTSFVKYELVIYGPSAERDADKIESYLIWFLRNCPKVTDLILIDQAHAAKHSSANIVVRSRWLLVRAVIKAVRHCLPVPPADDPTLEDRVED